VGGSEVQDKRTISQDRRPDDACGTFGASESLYHDAGKVWCQIPVLHSKAESGKDDQVSQGGIEIMPKPLNTQKIRGSCGTNMLKVTGFSEKELSELTSMDYREMIDTVLDMLDRRNNLLGTCLHNGYGVYTVWISGDTVNIEYGKTCD